MAKNNEWLKFKTLASKLTNCVYKKLEFVLYWRQFYDQTITCPDGEDANLVITSTKADFVSLSSHYQI